MRKLFGNFVQKVCGTKVWQNLSTSEAEADLFALNLAREPEAAATVAIQLSEYRKMSPGYWEEVIFYDHPSGENRIRMAMTWKQENLPVGSKN